MSEEGQGRYEALAALLLQVGHSGLLGVCVECCSHRQQMRAGGPSVRCVGATCFLCGCNVLLCGCDVLPCGCIGPPDCTPRTLRPAWASTTPRPTRLQAVEARQGEREQEARIAALESQVARLSQALAGEGKGGSTGTNQGRAVKYQ